MHETTTETRTATFEFGSDLLPTIRCGSRDIVAPQIVRVAGLLALPDTQEQPVQFAYSDGNL